MFTIESFALIVDATDESLMAWFPPISGIVQINAQLAQISDEVEPFDVNTKKNLTLGRFYWLTVTGECLSPLHYSSLSVSGISALPNGLSLTNSLPNNLPTNTVLESRVNSRTSQVFFTNVPVFVGNYLLSTLSYVGFSTLFGRILIPRFGNSLAKVDQFCTYWCDIAMCNYSDERQVFKWEVSAVHCESDLMPPIRLTKAILHNILREENDFIFFCSTKKNNSDSSSYELIHVNCVDLRESIVCDLKLGVELNIICGINNLNAEVGLFPSVSCFCTIKLEESINIKWLPFYEIKPYNLSSECCQFVQKMIDVLGIEKIRALYKPNVYEIFEKWMSIAAQQGL